ncbi:glycoside hydrolase family 47 protein [Piedraia hortae CBS 480.64]|uniref:alpha-1,2-Mannosidase n=1 Tax=Piedraia hortae CBS 480.64 TaxID=1314780 RepID=A0A6A7C6C8_9PEZI|nr:glycoside hydrolase family 47 protein [Piedraia hortae CBS 480.64]
MTKDRLLALRNEARDLFYHGYNNYMAHAFPADELRPITCKPQSRNRENPADVGVNDVLGNYSVTLVDSLSTLAILASDADPKHAKTALKGFQSGVASLVDLYGDGVKCGKKACGFDLDSKVQVFETTIRGVGGLLSAHLFAVGDLPIRGYCPKRKASHIEWPGFKYNGQLLRLAHDLASRLLPAFGTSTDLPYPRVNLRHGIPFYQDAEHGICQVNEQSSDPREITETCAAGAGTLLLEFTTLSRLTGDGRFEELAKRAFTAVWQRRSPAGLVGSGIDAETGQWITPTLTGIGAGIDSFLEYAFKSHVLLSGLNHNGSEDYLQVWQQAHAAIKRHVYRTAEKHPYYGQSDFLTGAPRFSWVDSLSAYYPGLLTLAGEIEEAVTSHLLYVALWTRYSALPERWHTYNGFIEPAFKHWAGRPEFIESTYYLYQATKDPWFLYVGEMAMRDIRRRCWTRCGWADLGDVISGEQRDRMESFFLGETAKYLYLLLTENHPLNVMDAPMVFSTEGHPLIVPLAARRTKTTTAVKHVESDQKKSTCPAASAPLLLTVSKVANRTDFFHAAALAQLPSNKTLYPWTLPPQYFPLNGTSSPMNNAPISTLTFPNLFPERHADGTIPLGALQKISDGIVINSLSNMRINMVQEHARRGEHAIVTYRISGIANVALGKDERVWLNSNALDGISPSDPHFKKTLDGGMIDLILQSGNGSRRNFIPAILATGEGAAVLPLSLTSSLVGALPHRRIFLLNDTLCEYNLPEVVAQDFDILVVKRGGCTFLEKLARIPELGDSSLKMVIVLSVSDAEPHPPNRELTHPLLEGQQLTPNGQVRQYPIALAMTDGRDETIAAFRNASVGVGSVQNNKITIQPTKVSGKEPAFGIRRRFWFESLGVRITNLYLL